MFQINFDYAFSQMDSDHIKSIGMEGNTLYITHHCRARMVQYYEGGSWYYIKAHDRTRSYMFPIKKDLEKMYAQLVDNKTIDRLKLEKMIRKYVPTRLGKASSLSMKREGEGLRGERF